jgi:LEA14-like dessication related protein
MFKKIQERIFPFIIATSALSVSASAAFYSVSGLSKLFAGAAFAVIIMATSLEVAKLVIASLLYQYRKTIPRLLKYYLSVAAVVLVLITSMGIYGFLSSAYQETAAKAGSIDSQIALIETKRDNVKGQLAVYNEEKTSINTAVSDLRSGLSNNKIQYRDRETGQIITTTSSSTRRALEKQLDQAIFRQTEINTKVDVLNEQLFKYETEIVEVKTGNDIAGELGPLKYLSGLTGIPMDRIINYLLLTIIFVFDPLAIALVIAANFAFEKLRPKTKENIYGEKKVVDDGMWTEEEMEDFRNQFNADHLIPDEDEVKINPQLQINFDQRIPDLEREIQILNNKLDDFKNKISAVVMFDGLEEEEKPQPPTEEEYVEAKMKDFRANMLLGEFRRRRLESSLKQEYKTKKDNDEDLTITY